MGIYGNSDPRVPSQWVPILNNSPPVPQNQVNLYGCVYSTVFVHMQITNGAMIYYKSLSNACFLQG